MPHQRRARYHDNSRVNDFEYKVLFHFKPSLHVLAGLGNHCSYISLIELLKYFTPTYTYFPVECSCRIDWQCT